MKNDDKIKNLLTEIDKKKSEIGSKPKAAWKTNGIIKIFDNSNINSYNINTVNSVTACVDLVSALLSQKTNYSEACKFLGVKELDSEKIFYINDAMDDLKLRNQMILWDVEKKKLDAMEKKLKDLRSVDAKTEDAINDIENELK